MGRNPASLPSTALADQAFSRTAGAELIPGNRVRLLRDAAENYPAWLKAIGTAKKWIHLETYIFYQDAVGKQFAEMLSAKAKEGIRVRVIVDWFGCFRFAPRGFWRGMRSNGVEVRWFNPFALDSPLGWVSRDHRKMLSVDGRIGFVSGLCIGEKWTGDPKAHIEPWRDTGVEIEGPAVRAIDRAFSDSWAATGKPLELKDNGPTGDAGDVPLRVVATVPSAGGVYWLDQLVTAMAQRSIWLSDAYFAGTASYVHALRSAARSGVDVRLLIPGVNDVPIVRAISRAGLRPLLESGVRVFEWNGPMMHAKTAVVDGCWARVGSTNLNLSSWIGNRELDVVIENIPFAQAMESMYLDDLSHSTEIVLEKGWRRAIGTRDGTPAGRLHGRMAGSTSRTAAGVMRLGRTVGAAVARRRELGPAEAVIMLWGALLLAALAVVVFLWPKGLAYPVAVLCVWMMGSLLVQAWRLLRQRKKRGP